jgi:hypothetical protein
MRAICREVAIVQTNCWGSQTTGVNSTCAAELCDGAAVRRLVLGKCVCVSVTDTCQIALPEIRRGEPCATVPGRPRHKRDQEIAFWCQQLRDKPCQGSAKVLSKGVHASQRLSGLGSPTCLPRCPLHPQLTSRRCATPAQMEVGTGVAGSAAAPASLRCMPTMAT